MNDRATGDGRRATGGTEQRQEREQRTENREQL
jgi:hypothetical protein